MLLNHAINASQVRVIAEDGDQLGILPLDKAVETAQSKGLDLVLMASTADPPVCKIMDYGKFKYQEQKKANEAKKRQHVIVVKEVKLRTHTEQHDFDVKLKNVRKFLEDGNKVKVTLRFRGREMMHSNLGLEQLKRVAAEVEELGKVDQMPSMEGRQMSMLIVPRK
ncbi:MAG: translation initiation factor IF-3 [Mariprofundaceae bacterium]